MASPIDQVDVIISQWNRERPDINSRPMGILGRISRLSPLIQANLAEVFSRHGLDFPGFDVLASLRRSGEPYELTPSQLAKSMIVTPGAVTQRLARLEEQGLITRSHSSTDRRKVTVGLTPLGRRTIDAAIVDHSANEVQLVAGYTPQECEELADLLRRLVLLLEGGAEGTETSGSSEAPVQAAPDSSRLEP